ncbi:hypothetical protein KAS08_03830 [Candidatus Pacearchaeota archaeon]|nr:hypothetical protein [Candidatus Pacearchaeota archaeon]
MDLKKFKPSRKVMYFSGAIILGIIVLFVIYLVQSNISEKDLTTLPTEKGAAATKEIIQTPITTPTPVPTKPKPINFEQYNYQFAETPVVNILTSMIGSTGKFAIYLPSTGYINVTKGSNYGVAFALQNPNPSGENYFEWEWTADDSVVQNCGVSKNVAMSWISMGSSSFGKIPQGWVDATSTYFKFPSDMKSCNLKYNFKATKDGADYASKQIEFNII